MGGPWLVNYTEGEREREDKRVYFGQVFRQLQPDAEGEKGKEMEREVAIFRGPFVGGNGTMTIIAKCSLIGGMRWSGW